MWEEIIGGGGEGNNAIFFSYCGSIFCKDLHSIKIENYSDSKDNISLCYIKSYFLTWLNLLALFFAG